MRLKMLMLKKLKIPMMTMMIREMNSIGLLNPNLNKHAKFDSGN